MNSLRSTIWATIGSGAQNLLGLATLIVLARLLDPTAFGLIAIAMIFIVLSQRILLETVTYAVVQQNTASYTEEFLNTAHVFSLFIGAILAITLFIAAIPISEGLGVPSLSNVLRTLAILPLIEAMSSVQVGVLRRQGKFKTLTIRTLGANIVAGAIGIYLAHLHLGVWALVSQQISLSLLSFLGLWSTSTWTLRLKCTKLELLRILKFSSTMSWNAVLFVLLNRMDIIAIALISGTGQTGLYNLAKRILRIVADVVVSGAATVSFSSFAATQDQPLKQRTDLLLRLKLIAIVAFPSFCGLSLISSELIPAVLGDQWSNATPILQILCIFGMIQAVQTIASNFLIAINRRPALLRSNAVGILLLACLLFFIENLSATTVAWSASLSSLITLMFQIKLIAEKSSVSSSDIYSSLFGSTLSAAIMAGTVLTLHDLFVKIVISPIGRILFDVCLGAAVYFCTIFLIERKFFNEMLSQLKKTKRLP
jgi:O-antigen/teichoic acid export membrane protein